MKATKKKRHDMTLDESKLLQFFIHKLIINPAFVSFHGSDVSVYFTVTSIFKLTNTSLLYDFPIN